MRIGASLDSLKSPIPNVPPMEETVLKTILIIGDIIRISMFLMTFYFFFEYFFNIPELNSNLCQIDQCYERSCNYKCIIYNPKYISSPNIEFENYYSRKFEIRLSYNSLKNEYENNKDIQNYIFKWYFDHYNMFILGLCIMGISILFRVMYDTQYLIHIFSSYTNVNGIQPLYAVPIYIIYIMQVTIILDTISLCLCTNLYNEKSYSDIFEAHFGVALCYIFFTFFMLGSYIVIISQNAPNCNCIIHTTIIFMAFWASSLACISCFESQYSRCHIIIILIILRFMEYSHEFPV